MTKLRIWDASVLFNTLAVAEEFRNSIEALYTASETNSMSNLPPSIIPTENLYSIVAGYSIMYDMLLKEHLIKEGNPMPSKTLQ